MGDYVLNPTLSQARAEWTHLSTYIGQYYKDAQILCREGAAYKYRIPFSVFD